MLGNTKNVDNAIKIVTSISCNTYINWQMNFTAKLN